MCIRERPERVNHLDLRLAYTPLLNLAQMFLHLPNICCVCTVYVVLQAIMCTTFLLQMDWDINKCILTGICFQRPSSPIYSRQPEFSFILWLVFKQICFDLGSLQSTSFPRIWHDPSSFTCPIGSSFRGGHLTHQLSVGSYLQIWMDWIWTITLVF